MEAPASSASGESCISGSLSSPSCQRTILLSTLSSASTNLYVAGCFGHTRMSSRRKAKDQKMVSMDPQLLGFENVGIWIISRSHHITSHHTSHHLRSFSKRICSFCLLPPPTPVAQPHCHSLCHLHTRLEYGPAQFHPFLSSPPGSIPFSNYGFPPH